MQKMITFAQLAMDFPLVPKESSFDAILISTIAPQMKGEILLAAASIQEGFKSNGQRECRLSNHLENLDQGS